MLLRGEGALAMNWMTLGDLAMANRDFNRRGPKDEPGVVAYLRPERNLGRYATPPSLGETPTLLYPLLRSFLFLTVKMP